MTAEGWSVVGEVAFDFLHVCIVQTNPCFAHYLGQCMTASVGHVKLGVVWIEQRIGDTATTGVVASKPKLVKKRFWRKRRLVLHGVDD